MIYGSINAKETDTAYTPVIRKALNILRTTDVTDMHHGKYPLDGDNLILQINEITTGPKDTKRSEVHKDYIDVHYMVHGHELIGFYPDHKDGAVLGDQGPVTEMIRTGALQMAIVPMSVPESYNTDFAIVSAPCLYDNLEQMKTAAREGVFDPLFTTTDKFNFEIVTLYTSGARHIYTDKPIVTPDDLKGCKIRVQDSDTYIQMINLMGGVGLPLAQGDVYAAAQQHVIEGAENSEVVYDNFKHYEVSPCFCCTNHLVMGDVVVANKDFLDDMSQEDRELFDKLIKESMELEFELWDQSSVRRGWRKSAWSDAHPGKLAGVLRETVS